MYALKRAHHQAASPSRHLPSPRSAGRQLHPMLQTRLLDRRCHSLDGLVYCRNAHELGPKLVSAVLPVLHETRTHTCTHGGGRYEYILGVQTFSFLFFCQMLYDDILQFVVVLFVYARRGEVHARSHTHLFSFVRCCTTSFFSFYFCLVIVFFSFLSEVFLSTPG